MGYNHRLAKGTWCSSCARPLIYPSSLPPLLNLVSKPLQRRGQGLHTPACPPRDLLSSPLSTPLCQDLFTWASFLPSPEPFYTWKGLHLFLFQASFSSPNPS